MSVLHTHVLCVLQDLMVSDTLFTVGPLESQCGRYSPKVRAYSTYILYIHIVTVQMCKALTLDHKYPGTHGHDFTMIIIIPRFFIYVCVTCDTIGISVQKSPIQ